MEELEQLLEEAGVILEKNPTQVQLDNIIELVQDLVGVTLAEMEATKDASVVLEVHIPRLTYQYIALQQAQTLLHKLENKEEPIRVELWDDYGLWVGHSILSREKGPSVLELTPWEYIQEAMHHDSLSGQKVEDFLKEFYKPEAVDEYMAQLGFQK